MNNFYVYVYLDSRRKRKYCYKDICFIYEPIYIGKGKDNRININHTHNIYLCRKIDKINNSTFKLIKIKLLNNISEKLAFDYEIKYIKEIGRKSLNKGSLLNLTDGGEGNNGISLSYNKIKSYIENNGYKLLTNEYDYINTNHKILVKCPDKNHKPYKVTFNKFKRRHRCKLCYLKKRKISYDEIKSYIENNGYKLLATEYEYIDTKHKILVKCSNKNHESYMVTFNSFKYSNSRCKLCSREIFSKKIKISYDEIKSYIENNGYKLLTTENEYIDTLHKILVKCPDKNHGSYMVTFNNFKCNNSRCKLCYFEKRKISYNKIKSYIENNGYKLLTTKSEYIDTKYKILVKCPDENHKSYITTFNNFKNNNNRCKLCHI